MSQGNWSIAQKGNEHIIVPYKPPVKPGLLNLFTLAKKITIEKGDGSILNHTQVENAVIHIEKSLLSEPEKVQKYLILRKAVRTILESDRFKEMKETNLSQERKEIESELQTYIKTETRLKKAISIYSENIASEINARCQFKSNKYLSPFKNEYENCPEIFRYCLSEKPQLIAKVFDICLKERSFECLEDLCVNYPEIVTNSFAFNTEQLATFADICMKNNNDKKFNLADLLPKIAKMISTPPEIFENVKKEGPINIVLSTPVLFNLFLLYCITEKSEENVIYYAKIKNVQKILEMEEVSEVHNSKNNTKEYINDINEILNNSSDLNLGKDFKNKLQQYNDIIQTDDDTKIKEYLIELTEIIRQTLISNIRNIWGRAINSQIPQFQEISKHYLQ